MNLVQQMDEFRRTVFAAHRKCENPARLGAIRLNKACRSLV